MNIKFLEDRLKEWSIPFAVVADLKTGHTTRIGCATGLGFDDLENTLFRDADTVFATGRSLEGQGLPRTWSQGINACFVCKPNDTTIVGLFCNKMLSPIDKYYLSKSLNLKIMNVFSCA